MANQRGTLVSSTNYIKIEDVENELVTPSEMLSSLAGVTVQDLIKKAGYQNDIKVTIKAVPDFHARIGFEIIAKTRLEN